MAAPHRECPLSEVGHPARRFGKLQLVRTDASLNVQRRESDDAPGAGWSQVAKGNPARRAPQNAPLGVKSGFAVLSLPRRKKKIEVADDWEVEEENEVEKEAEQEKGASGATSGVSSDVDGEIVPEPSADEVDVALPERMSGAWADSE